MIEQRMSEKPRRRDHYDFPGITVIVPEQYGDQIVAIEKGSINPKDIPNQPGKFTLIRIVANIALVRRQEYENGIEILVDTFDPPIEIRVGYNFSDAMEYGCDYKQLKLAYLDDKDWVDISDDKHEFLILPPSTGTIAEAKIWTWVGDPPIAWGK